MTEDFLAHAIALHSLSCEAGEVVADRRRFLELAEGHCAKTYQAPFELRRWAQTVACVQTLSEAANEYLQQADHDPRGLEVRDAVGVRVDWGAP